MPITDDDFFKQLAGNQPAPKTPSKDEIVFRDEAGKMKVLKGEEVFDFDRLDIPAPKKEIIKEVFPQAKTEIKEIKPSESLKKEVIAMPGLALALDFDRAANEVIKKSGLKSDDPEKIKRLKNVIVSRLRNIRDQMEVREILADSPLAGGLGFYPPVVQKNFNFILMKSDSNFFPLRRDQIPGRRLKANPPIFPGLPSGRGYSLSAKQ